MFNYKIINIAIIYNLYYLIRKRHLARRERRLERWERDRRERRLTRRERDRRERDRLVRWERDRLERRERDRRVIFSEHSNLPEHLLKYSSE